MGKCLFGAMRLDFSKRFKPKFVKRFLDGANLIRNAMQDYADEVRTKKFPSSEHEYTK
ncbi:3-methyl-2-oxobutanoate hydroxymethyltransferase [Campylobacter hyointestinalis]|uniref:3-methyl-2-oxobutanoate hydroxymethyltransferase n=1 Tax=Campylobacter hyointestinalis TaxID=198 RepID=UPI002162D722|nr:3-methyl-2-oxobutanoate hydroxymethyltransferase [Campylobacter hyointestinalis]